jgi:hypothetical protein
MNRIVSTIFLNLGLSLAAYGATACSGSVEPVAPGDQDTPERRQQTLKLTDNCEFASCGSLPSSLSSEPVVECSSTQEAECAWSDTGKDAVASYRFCADSECPKKPDVECPAGTTFGSQQCGSENDAPCAWTTSCVPPRVTTPCADSGGCDDQPMQAIGIICKDGSNGGLACVTDGDRCFWERDCD